MPSLSSCDGCRGGHPAAPHLLLPLLCRPRRRLLLLRGGGAARVAAGAALHREQLKGLPPRLLLQGHPFQQLHRVHALAEKNLLLILVLLPCSGAGDRWANSQLTVRHRRPTSSPTRLTSGPVRPIPHQWSLLSGSPLHQSLQRGWARRLPRKADTPRHWRSPTSRPVPGIAENLQILGFSRERGSRMKSSRRSAVLTALAAGAIWFCISSSRLWSHRYGFGAGGGCRMQVWRWLRPKN